MIAYILYLITIGLCYPIDNNPLITSSSGNEGEGGRTVVLFMVAGE